MVFLSWKVDHCDQAETAACSESVVANGAAAVATEASTSADHTTVSDSKASNENGPTESDGAASPRQPAAASKEAASCKSLSANLKVLPFLFFFLLNFETLKFVLRLALLRVCFHIGVYP